MKTEIVTIEPILVDISDAAKILSLSKSTIEKLCREGNFPQSRAASARSARFLVSELKEWAASRPQSDFLPPDNCANGGRNSRRNADNAEANRPYNASVQPTAKAGPG